MDNKLKTLLIVEDEGTLLQTLSDKFSNEQLNVLEAKDGKIGLDIALKEQPDLILLDIVMPNMDGITMLKKLRENEWGKSVKVMILTNLSDGEKVSEAFEMDTFEFLVKSDWKLEDVVLKIKDSLGL